MKTIWAGIIVERVLMFINKCRKVKGYIESKGTLGQNEYFFEDGYFQVRAETFGSHDHNIYEWQYYFDGEISVESFISNLTVVEGQKHSSIEVAI
ncbi:hypothetical protein [Paenibacillus tundrae]|uniref:hypothetical protein n=1 Tax=Paenibacillus tundrae TaxID=528187 RepID=UPI0022A94217|nr:hypothetical protein [Paenibacillus tundrae]MCZ1268617.1 hypothetical protein [Paenibacillus tundrae]